MRNDRALEEADYVVLLVSREALQSNFVGYELDVVLWLEMKERRERLLPVIVDDLPYDHLPAVLGPIRAIALRDSGVEGVFEAIRDRIEKQIKKGENVMPEQMSNNDPILLSSGNKLNGSASWVCGSCRLSFKAT